MSPRSPRSTAITSCTGSPRSRRCRRRRTRSAGGATRSWRAACLISSPNAMAGSSAIAMPACSGRARAIALRSRIRSMSIRPKSGAASAAACCEPVIAQLRRALGYRQMIAVIGGSETVASIRLHEALGFAHMGVFEAVGFKFGRWIDIVLMQRALGEAVRHAARARRTRPSRDRRWLSHDGRLPARGFAASTRISITTPRPGPSPSTCARRSARNSRSNSAAGTTSRSGRIRSRCIRSPSRPRNSAASCRG